MARFRNVAESATFLGKLHADIFTYGFLFLKNKTILNLEILMLSMQRPRGRRVIKILWQLANFREPHYLACDGMTPEGHIDDSKARADTKGELLACNALY